MVAAPDLPPRRRHPSPAPLLAAAVSPLMRTAGPADGTAIGIERSEERRSAGWTRARRVDWRWDLRQKWILFKQRYFISEIKNLRKGVELQTEFFIFTR